MTHHRIKLSNFYELCLIWNMHRLLGNLANLKGTKVNVEHVTVTHVKSVSSLDKEMQRLVRMGPTSTFIPQAKSNRN